MSTEIILMYAIGVFVLMAIGMILTMIEFNKISDEPSIRKGSGGPETVKSASEKAKMRLVDSDESAA